MKNYQAQQPRQQSPGRKQNIFAEEYKAETEKKEDWKNQVFDLRKRIKDEEDPYSIH